MKFQYAPGLPGYGTRGVDGSTGLIGMAIYFSAYDGTTDSITIKSKIVSNKILFPTDETLPGYPDRVYQTGDVFVDKNGKVFKIDFNETNLYSNTSQSLNTSGLFETASLTTVSPTHTRWANSYSSSKILVDIVYASIIPGNYAANPSRTDGSIYGVGAVDFAQVQYVNNSINSYHPFTVFTNSQSTSRPDFAVAWVKENTNNVWHLGNKDNGGVMRDVSLYLDFKDVMIPGNVRGGLNIHGDLSTNGNTRIDGFLRVTNDVSVLSNFYVPNGYITVGSSGIKNHTYNQTLNVKTIDNSTLGTGVISIGTGSIINATTTGTGTNAGSLYVYAGHGQPESGGNYTAGIGGSIDISAGYGGTSTGGSDGEGGSGGTLLLTSGYGGNGAGGGAGGALTITSGFGGVANDDFGGDAGNMSITTGFGGNAAEAGGDGGSLTIKTGRGGNSDNSYQGYGGNISIICGSSGRAGDVVVGRIGGCFSLEAGTGGHSPSGTGGLGGYVFIRSGTGGIGDNGGVGGDVSINGGIGATDDLGLDGGHLYLQAGTGGYGISAEGGNGGDVYIFGGTGGPALGNSGDGGDVFIEGGKGNSNGYVYLRNLPLVSSAEYYLVLDVSSRIQRMSYSSDIRFKNILGKINNSLSGLMSINGYYFNYNDLFNSILGSKVDTNELQMGLVAQEVEKVFPELVCDKIEKGFQYKTLKYDKFVPYLVEAIKEQQEIINRLIKDVSTLEYRLNNLKL